MIYCDNLKAENSFIQKIAAECNAVFRYPEFLHKIQEQANQKGSFSIFQKNSYDVQVLQKTAQRYQGLASVKIDYSPQTGIYTALSFVFTDVIAVLCVLLISITMLHLEKEKGLLSYIYVMPSGRIRTAIAKLIAMLISSGAVVLLLYGINFIFCQFFYGLGDLSRSVQSVPALMRCPWPISLGTYILYYFVSKWTALFVVAACIMTVTLYARSISHAVTGTAALLGINYVMRAFTSATGKRNIFRYCNLIGALNTNERLGEYRMLYWFGKPISMESVINYGLLVAFATTVIFYVVRFSNASVLLRLQKQIRVSWFVRQHWNTTLFQVEWKKLLQMNGAVIFLLVYFLLQGYRAFTIHGNLSIEEHYCQHYMTQAEGPANKKTYDKIKQMGDEFTPLVVATKQWKTGKITNSEYKNILNGFSNLRERLTYYQDVIGRFQMIVEYQEERPRAEIVYETGYNKLFDLQDQADLQELLSAALITIMCFSGYFSMEKQSGMEKLLEAMPRGREDTVRYKLLCTNIICTIMTIVSIAPRTIMVLRDYGLGRPFAPVYSLSAYQYMPELPIVAVIMLMFAARWFSLRFIAGMTLLLSQKIGNPLATLFLALLLFCLSPALALLGLTNAKWISLYPIFHAAAMCTEFGGFFLVLILLVCTAIYIWGCNTYLYCSFGQQD